MKAISGDLNALASMELTFNASLLLVRGPDIFGAVVSIEFDGVLAFRWVDEGDAINLVALMMLEHRPASLIYELTKSDLLEWFLHESSGIYDGRHIRAFLVTTKNDIVHVLSFDEPIISRQEL